MNQAALKAIGRLLDAFPQSSGNPDLTLDTFDRVLTGVPGEAVEAAVDRFLSGAVEGQSLRFAPSIAEFNQEARRVAEMHSYRDRPRLSRQPYQPASGPAPFQVKQAQMREKFANWSVFKTEVSLEQVRAMHASKQLPAGAVWSAALGTVYVPRKAGV